MLFRDIAKQRLVNQHLAGTKFTTPQQMVSYFGAIQAQDYPMAKWAIGLRLAASEASVEDAINNGSILRTHILRPTWHFISATDIHWMLTLTAPHVKASMASLARQLGLDAQVSKRCNTIIEKSLSGGQHLTREELMQALNKKGIVTSGFRSMLIMMNAELEGIVCNGYRRGKQFTYSLLPPKSPTSKTFTKEEALAELATRYFTSHGPATLKDFCWWSGLSVTNAGLAIESIRSTFHSQIIENNTYWFAGIQEAADKIKKHIVFLPAFDEFLVSYKDRSASIDPAAIKTTITNNGIFRPVIVVNGQVIGVWKRTIKNDTVTIETHFFNEIAKSQKQQIFKAAKQFGDFLELKTIIQ